MADDDRVTVMQFEDEIDQFPENNVKAKKDKKPRVRKTKEEQIAQLEAQKAIYREKISQLEAKKQKLSLTPEQKKEAKRKAKDNCKLMILLVFIELSKNGDACLTLENFKKMLYSKLTHPLEIAFLNKIFKEIENK